MTLPRLTAARYVQPLREGGSLPAVVETEGAGLWVVKFRGAGQGAKALVAELVVGELARAVGLPVPALAIIDLPSEFGRSEPDPEIQELLERSTGVNIGLQYLDGAFNFDQLAARELVTDDFASRLVWLDALVINPDRTHRNPNLLIHERTPWLIDHGAALYAHYDWASVTEASTRTPFPRIETHLLLTSASEVSALDESLAACLTPEVLASIVESIPDELLDDALDAATPAAARARYVEWLTVRLGSPRAWVAEIEAARARRLSTPPLHLGARR